MENRAWWQAPEMLVAFAALVVSVFAVFVGAYSAYTDRTYARASVWPNIYIEEINSVTDEFSSYSLTLYSNGIGPAILKHASLVHEDKEIVDYMELRKPYDNELQNTNWSQTTLKTRVIPANTSVVVFKLTDTNKEAVKQFKFDMKDLSLSVCYCSVYEECWQVNKQNQPKAVDACPTTFN